MGLGLLSGADWGKVGGKVHESSGGERSYGPLASTPKTFPRQTAAAPRHGDSAAAPPNQAKIWTAATSQRRSLLVQGLPGPAQGAARRRALHPPRRLMPNLTTGAMRDCLGSPPGAPSPAHYSAPSGVLHFPPPPLSFARPCNYRRIGRASHTSSPAIPCLGGSWPQGHMGATRGRIVQCVELQRWSST